MTEKLFTGTLNHNQNKEKKNAPMRVSALAVCICTDEVFARLRSLKYKPRREKTRLFSRFPTRSVQPHEIDGALKFRIYEVEEL